MAATSRTGWLVAWLWLFSGTIPAADALRVAIISDLNGGYGSTVYADEVDRAVARIVQLRPDLVISTGDMVAGQRRPHLDLAEVRAMWSAFHERVSRPLEAAGIPLVVTPGNHDASAYQGFSRERVEYGEQWSRRRPDLDFVDSAAFPFHYAFASKDVLFVSIDATVIGRLSKPQMRWLRDLLTIEGPRYRYRVVFSHLPLWPFAQGRLGEIIGDPELQSLLEGTGVDLYLSGHHHAFYPGSRGGVAFVGQACLGAGVRRLAGVEERSEKAFTLLQFGDDRIEIAALKAPAFADTVAWSSLPERIATDVAELVRADLARVAVELRLNQ